MTMTEAKSDLCICGHTRNYHQCYLTGGETAHETAHSCKRCLPRI